MLDIDRDGRMDRAVLVRQADDPYVDLWIYLRTGDELLDLSRRPDFVKDGIADDPILRKQRRRIAHHHLRSADAQ